MFNAPYIIYKCETCSRETERRLDARRPDPLRCTITLNCRGKMTRTGIRAIKKFLFPATSSSSTDYRPRGGAPSLNLDQIKLAQISLSSSNSGLGLTVAVIKRRENSNGNAVFYTTAANGTELVTEVRLNSTINPFPLTTTGNIVLYELKPELVKFKKYSYLANTVVQSVSGPDNSADRNILRFLPEEGIKVYVNGIELGLSEYSRENSGEIIFTPIITSTNNLIEVVVFDDISLSITEANTVRLPISWIQTSNIVRSSFCWGDTARVQIGDEILSPLFCTDVSILVPGRSYGLVGIEIKSVDGVQTPIDPSSASILLGKQPFGFIDKDLYAYAKVSELVNDKVISYKNSSNTSAPELTISESDIFQSYDPLKIIDYLSITDSIATTVPEGTINLRRKYTLGPT